MIECGYTNLYICYLLHILIILPKMQCILKSTLMFTNFLYGILMKSSSSVDHSVKTISQNIKYLISVKKEMNPLKRGSASGFWVQLLFFYVFVFFFFFDSLVITYNFFRIQMLTALKATCMDISKSMSQGQIMQFILEYTNKHFNL